MPIVTSKWSPRDIVAEHLQTLRDARSGKARALDFVELYGAPGAVAFACWWFGVRFESVDPLIAGVSIFTALLFGVLVYVFQLRVRVKDSASLAGDLELARLIDELEANVSYTVLVGLVSDVTLVALSATKAKDIALSAVGTSVATGLLLHLFLAVLLVLKRTRSAYSRATR